MKKQFKQQVYEKACDYLSRRDHSVLEIYNKLTKYFNTQMFDEKSDNELPTVINAVIEQLKDQKFLSNSRFTERYISNRLSRNQGPRLIQQQLRAKGITNELWSDSWIQFENQELESCQLALDKWLKKSRNTNLKINTQRDKAMRFLSSRGFYPHTIYEAIANYS